MPMTREHTKASVIFIVIACGSAINWLPGLDSNQEIRLQRPLCYQLHYRAVCPVFVGITPLRRTRGSELRHLRPHTRPKLFTSLSRGRLRQFRIWKQSEHRGTTAAHQGADCAVVTHGPLDQFQHGKLANRRRFQRVEQASRNTCQVVLSQRAQQETNFWRWHCQPRLRRGPGPAFIGPFRRDAETGVYQQNPSRELAPDWFDFLAAPAAECRAARQEEIYVRTQTCGERV